MAIQGQDTAQSGGRGSPNAWSPASNGQNWSQVAGSATLGFTGSELTLSGNISKNVLLLGSLLEQASDIVCHFVPSANSDVQGIVIRAQSGTTYYRAPYSGSTLSIVKVVTNGATTIASIGVSAPTVGYFLHFQVNSLSAGNLQASYWRDEDGFDPGLFLIATDSTSQLKPPGQFGVYGQCNAGVDVLAFDSFVVQDVIEPPKPPASYPDSPYGITLHVPTNKVPLLAQQTITDLQGFGQGAWLRYQLHWSTVDDGSGSNAGQGNGVYNWQWSDYAVSLCNSFGFRILWPVQDPPLNYKTISPVDGSTQPAASTNYGNPAAWTTFMQAVCARYNGTVASPYTGYPMVLDAVSWENEDYDANNHTPRDSQSQWLQGVANASYTAMRATGYTGYIGFCAVRKTTTLALQHVTNWITNLFTYQTGLLLGILTDPKIFFDFHYYRDGAFSLDPTTTNTNTPSVALELATIFGLIRQYGSTGQVWCNEFGWSLFNATTDHFVSSTVTVSAATDSQYIQEMFDALRQGGASKGMIFTLDPTSKESQITIPNSPTDGTLSTVTASSSPKSIAQLVGSSYTYLQPYSDLQAYIALYPSFPAPPVNSATIVSGAGVASIESGAGVGTIASGAGVGSVTSGAGVASIKNAQEVGSIG